jgi:AcrR family transcriptional regulator
MQISTQLPTLVALSADAPTRIRILTAAMETLHAEGFAAMTQQAVALRAGVRQSHVTYYFPTRNDLLRETAQFGIECMLTPITDAASMGSITLEEFKALLLPKAEDRMCGRLMFGIQAAGEHDASIQQWLLEFDAQILGRIKAGFLALGFLLDDDALHMLHFTYVGAMAIEATQPTEASLACARRAVGRAIDLVLNHAQRVETIDTSGAKPRLKPRSSAE